MLCAAHNRCTGKHRTVGILHHCRKQMAVTCFHLQSIIQRHYSNGFFTDIHKVYRLAEALGIHRLLRIKLGCISHSLLLAAHLPNACNHAEACSAKIKVGNRQLILKLRCQKLIPGFRSIQAVGMQIIFVTQQCNIAQIQACPLSCTVTQLCRHLVGFLGNIRLQNMLLIRHEILLTRTAQPDIKPMLAQVIQAFLLCASGQIAYIYFYTGSLAVAVGNNLRQLGAHAAAELQLLRLRLLTATARCQQSQQRQNIYYNFSHHLFRLSLCYYYSMNAKLSPYFRQPAACRKSLVDL